jgi:hypothetical protein
MFLKLFLPYRVDEILQPRIFACILTLDFSLDDFEGSASDIDPTKNIMAIIKTNISVIFF